MRSATSLINALMKQLVNNSLHLEESNQTETQCRAEGCFYQRDRERDKNESWIKITIIPNTSLLSGVKSSSDKVEHESAKLLERLSFPEFPANHPHFRVNWGH